MNLLKRLHNLWFLSAYEPQWESKSESLKDGTIVTTLIKKPEEQKAQIIKKKENIEQALNEDFTIR